MIKSYKVLAFGFLSLSSVMIRSGIAFTIAVERCFAGVEKSSFNDSTHRNMTEPAACNRILAARYTPCSRAVLPTFFGRCERELVALVFFMRISARRVLTELTALVRWFGTCFYLFSNTVLRHLQWSLFAVVIVANICTDLRGNVAVHIVFRLLSPDQRSIFVVIERVLFEPSPSTVRSTSICVARVDGALDNRSIRMEFHDVYGCSRCKERKRGDGSKEDNGTKDRRRVHDWMNLVNGKG